MPDKRREELHCHNCDQYVQFMLDYDLDGSHILNCPNCGHQHYRIIEKGRITAQRWGQDPSQAVPALFVNVTTMTTTAGTATAIHWATSVSSSPTSWVRC